MTKTTHEQSEPSDSLDQVNFVLNDKEAKEFDQLLANPLGPNEALRELMAQTPPWEASQG
jgi:uncharacterized protein (DUF1778 family)